MNVDQEIEEAGKRGFKSAELPIRLQAHITSRVKSYDSANVIAMVPGVDSSPGGNVLYTAHYDHLGIDPAAAGDKIFNGAVDNGTGCASSSKWCEPTPRLRSRRLVPSISRPSLRKSRACWGLNILGCIRRSPSATSCWISILMSCCPLACPPQSWSTARSAPASIRLSKRRQLPSVLRSSPMTHLWPDIYYRSDHFSLARFGVPAFSVDEGTLFAGHPAEWGKQQRTNTTSSATIAPRRISCRYGLPRRCQIGSVRVLIRVAGFVLAARDLETGRRV